MGGLTAGLRIGRPVSVVTLTVDAGRLRTGNTVTGVRLHGLPFGTTSTQSSPPPPTQPQVAMPDLRGSPRWGENAARNWVEKGIPADVFSRS